MYRLNSSKSRGGPKLKSETPNNGIARSAAGISPIEVLIIAVRVNAAIISLILIHLLFFV